MKHQKGSITLFSAIALLLISATIFTLLEGVRFSELNHLASLQTEVVMDAVLSNYNNDLWENYHLLGTDRATAENIIYEISNGKSSGLGTNLLRLKREDASMVSYTLLTDGNGAVFVNTVSAYMRNNLLYEVIREIYSQYESVKSVIDTNQVDGSNIENALEKIEENESEEANSVGTSDTEDENRELMVRSILESAKQWIEMELLELVLEDTQNLSDKEVAFENSVLERVLDEGMNYTQEEISWEDRILFQQYLCTYMSHFREVKEDRELDYEVENLLEAKNNDLQNLEGIISKLLVIRAAANYLHLISNAQKQAKAEAMATLLAGASLNPVFISAVKTGLLTAWALAESILDVRALLAGKKVPLIKSEEYWTTNFEEITEIMNEFVVAKECSWGLGYENYLGILLLLKEEEDVAMRALQLQELTIRKQRIDDSFRIDTLMTRIGVNIEYSYNPVFPFLEIFDEVNLWEYKIFANKEMGYY